MAESLYKRATGYEHKEDDIKQYLGEIIVTETIKHYPPDTAAMNIWLKNRRGKIKDVDDSGQETGGHKWADKQEIDLTNAGKAFSGNKVFLVKKEFEELNSLLDD